MKAIDIARKLAQLDQREDACRAYTLAIHENNGQDPALDMEAALYILEHEGDYKVSYTCFRNLYNQGHFREDVLSILDQAFYQPNEREQRTRYERNCRALERYPYCFRRDFPEFDFLPIRFYPYDDNGFLPHCRAEERFDDYINFKKPVVSRNFFRDLEKPILADDVFSQYELEYLNDNIRPSEYIGRENHLYLYYTDWEVFCSYLACLNLAPLLEAKKIVFLFEGEYSQYPIDFKERFGVDYSQCPVKPIGIREVNRMIWHTQLASHNGGDFFNEVFDGHPNLLAMSSIMLSDLAPKLAEGADIINHGASQEDRRDRFRTWTNKRLVEELLLLRDCTEKDVLVGFFLDYLYKHGYTFQSDSRIAPALFFQPHFGNLKYDIRLDEETGRAILYSDEYEQIRRSSLFRGFKYIKTFTPIRRPTTSYGAAVKFMSNPPESEDENENENSKKIHVVPDEILERMLNRSFMMDWQDRLFQDSVLVRFEDGKLNPKATFTALAAFLDIPYTESMTYCSLNGQVDPEQLKGNARGFDPVTVYRTYDDYANDEEREFLEYMLRDAYEYLGYDFQYYDGGPMDQARLEELMNHFDTLDSYIRKDWSKVFKHLEEQSVSVTAQIDKKGAEGQETRIDAKAATAEEQMKNFMDGVYKQRQFSTMALEKGLRLVNLNGQPLRMMPKLRLDPALLEQPLYH